MTDFTDAACADEDPDLFFPYERENQFDKGRRLTTALAICDRCPLVKECLDEALRTDERIGVRAGMDLETDPRYVALRQTRAREQARARAEADARRAAELATNPARQPCGTEPAAQAHLRRGEHLDRACMTAHNRATQKRRARRAERQAANREGQAA